MPTPASVSFRGAFTAIVTPFTADGHAIDYGALREQIRRQAAGGVTGIVVAGTTGESPTLSEGEYKQLLTRAVDAGHQEGLLVIAGTGSNSTHHAVELHKLAHAVGADGSLSVNPYYNKPVQEGLYRHFMTQADSAPLPIMLYNIPGRSGVALSTDTIERLARHEHIVAIKEATGSTDSASEITQRCPKLALLSGDDSMTLPFASVGGVGVVSVVSNVLPAKVSALCKAFLENRWADALAIHRTLYTFSRAMFIETNPIPVKAALRLLGQDTGVLRLPMTEAQPATVAKVKAALVEAGVLSAGAAGAASAIEAQPTTPVRA